MKATPAHKTYVGDLTNLMDESGRAMSGFVMNIFKTALKSSGNSAAFVRNIRSVKPKIQRALSKKAMETANKSFELGKKFAQGKVKK